MTPRARRIALPTGLTYHLLEWGAGEHTLVLVHGFLDSAWGWTEVAERLAGRFRVIAVDLRGHGDSDWLGAGGYYHFFDYVADLAAVIDRVGGDLVSVAGHSMGGTIVGYWAGTRPSRPARVVLLEGLGIPEPGGDLPTRTRGWIDTWTTTARTPKVMASIDDAAARLRRHDPRLTEARARALATHGTRAVDGGVTWKHDPLHLTQGPYPFRLDAAASYWRAVTAPVLYLDGGASSLRLAEDELARRLACFADVRRQTIADAGHMLMRHAPEAVADAIAAHCALA